MPRGVSNIPTTVGTVTVNGKSVPVAISLEMRSHLMDIRQTVLQGRGPTTPPGMVTDLTATPLPGGNLVQWTGSDADYYQVLWALQPNINNAQIAFSGNANQYADVFGATGVTRYYWVLSWRNNGLQGLHPAGPVSSASAGTGSTVVPPTPPVPGLPIVRNPITGTTGPRGPVRIGGV